MRFDKFIRYLNDVRQNPQTLAVVGALVVLSIITTQLSCRCRLRERHATPVLLSSISLSDRKPNRRSEPELVAEVENRVARMILSPDRKRMLLETRPSDGDVELSTAVNEEDRLVVELLNIEFTDARYEKLTSERPYLIASDQDCVAFDKNGARIFWLEKEDNAALTASLVTDQNSVVRGANVDDDVSPALAPSIEWVNPKLKPLPLYLPWDDSDQSADVLPERTTETAQDEISSTKQILSITEDSPLVADGADVALEDADDFPETLGLNAITTETSTESDSVILSDSTPSFPKPSVVNIVKTRLLETEDLLGKPTSPSKGSRFGSMRMKTSSDVRNADELRLSPQADWLICRFQNRRAVRSPSIIFTETGAESANQESDVADAQGTVETSETFSLEWALVPVRDRARTVRFPQNIKMTFDFDVSKEERFGKVVDVLDVSDAENLVATLVEEQVDGSTESPRYSIVVWDLAVAKTVDLSKAIMPLRAVEISQIPIPCKISRKHCKFSPSGKAVAARTDPRYISVWQSTNGRSVIELGELPGDAEDFDFSPSETRIVVGTSGDNPQVSVWELRKGLVYLTLETFPDRIGSVDAVAFSSNERFVYFADDFGKIRRWDVHPRVTTID